MNDKEIEQQINDIIEGEIQNSINEYLEQQKESKGEDSGLGFAGGEGKLNVSVSQAEVNKLIKEYKKAMKYKKSNLGQVEKLDLTDQFGRQL
tara:strand:+ start:368 stop:643 length:276 start_codon:yes stop_codon:yes gene_type:complete